MISYADVEKLRGMRAPEPVVLPLYLPVPLHPRDRVAGGRGAGRPGHGGRPGRRAGLAA
jgi:hypothetical protein